MKNQTLSRIGLAIVLSPLAFSTIENPSRLKALFARYTKDDALCCPSRTSEVTYRN